MQNFVCVFKLGLLFFLPAFGDLQGEFDAGCLSVFYQEYGYECFL